MIDTLPKSKPPGGKAEAPVTPGGGKSPAELVRASNRWRDNYNALRALTIARVVAILEAADRGDFAELQLVMRKLERRYPVLKGLKSRRLAAIEKLDWDIKVVEELPDGASAEQAEAQRKFLRSRYELVENLTDVFGFLVTAEFRGYAILQKHRYTTEDGASVLASRNDGAVRELHWLPQDQFSRDGQLGDFFYNQDSRFGVGGEGCASALGEENRIGGELLPREEFVIREVESPLYEVALIAFVNWAMGRKDHAAFVEIFGLPNGVAIMPPNIPAGQEDNYRVAAEKVADGVSGALPNGSDIKFPTASVRGSAPFKEYCDAQDADVVLAGTGGRLAMLTADKGGLGDGPSQEHSDAFDEIAQADARKINRVLQQDFDKLELAAEFPGQPCLAYFELCAVEQEDVQALVTNVATLEGTGLQTDVEEVSEKVGLKLTRVARPAAPAGFGFGQGNERQGNEQPKPEPEELDAEGKPIKNRAGQSDLTAALAAKIDPVAAMINRITQIKDDAQFRAELEKFVAAAPQLATIITADVRRQQAALEHSLKPELAKGLAGK